VARDGAFHPKDTFRAISPLDALITDDTLGVNSQREGAERRAELRVNRD
jgi:hypothetical protein